MLSYITILAILITLNSLSHGLLSLGNTFSSKTISVIGSNGKTGKTRMNSFYSII